MGTMQISRTVIGPLYAAFLVSSAIGLSGCGANEAQLPPAARESEQQQLVEQAQLAVVSLRSSSVVGGGVNRALRDAKGVLVFPDLLRGGFGVGAAGGQGVLLTRKPNGRWSDPAFYVLVNASFGLQIGGEGGQVIFAIMNDGALRKIINGNSVNLGADMSVAAGPVGGGAQGATTTNLGADVLAFSLQQGAFAGALAQVGILHPRQEWNTTYYGADATPRGIVIDARFYNAGAQDLRAALATAPAPRAASPGVSGSSDEGESSGSSQE